MPRIKPARWWKEHVRWLEQADREHYGLYCWLMGVITGVLVLAVLELYFK